nr:hypothetical protein [uncultured Capnocytophaga sp.]
MKHLTVTIPEVPSFTTDNESQIISYFNKEIKKLKKDNDCLASKPEIIESIKQKIRKKNKENEDDYDKASCLRSSIGVHLDILPKHLLLNGDKEAWIYFTKNLLWQEKIITELFNLPQIPPRYSVIAPSSKSLGGLLALSTIWGKEEMSSIFRKYINLYFNDYKDSYKNTELHHLFVFTLYDLLKTKQLNEDFLTILPENTIYKTFLSIWDTTDLEFLSKVLYEVCNQHIFSTMHTPTKFSEIFNFAFIPYEIKLIELLRKQKQLETPIINHPLLKTPLAQIPLEVPFWEVQQDEVLNMLNKQNNK